MNASQIQNAINVSLRAVNARLGGASKDIEKCYRENSASFASAKTAEYLAQSNIDPDMLGLIFPRDGNINPKVPMRALQYINAVHAGSYPDIDATTLRALIATRAAGGTLNRDALHMLITGKIKLEGISPNQKGVGIRWLDRLVGRVGSNTVETQLSRSFGLNGFCRAFGMVKTVGAVNFSMTIQPENLYVKRIFELVDGATDSQIDAVLGEK